MPWQPDAPTEGDKLIVLDGAHRLAAYRAAGWQGEIPALILIGVDRRTALGAALKANSKRILGLTQAERTDAAWRLVCEQVTPRFKVPEIVQLADVAGRTVDNMRQRLRTMQKDGIEITGAWLRDRRSMPEGDDTGWLAEAQRKAEIDLLARDIRDLLDRRKHPERAILRESEAVWEAVHVAMGENAMKSMLSYLLAGDDDEAEDWLEMAKAGRDAVEPESERDEEDPPF